MEVCNFMFKMIIKNWLRNINRFILLLIGTILISGGLISLIAISESNKGTIINSLEEKWTASYDIIVRPKGNESATEKDNYMDPNYLSGLSGGISFKELDVIKDIDGVDIAAPISIIGYTTVHPIIENFQLKQDGIYRLQHKFVENDGIRNYKIDINTYHAINLDTEIDSFEAANKYDLLIENQEVIPLRGDFTILLAAIDPQAEARLVGLDQAIVKNNNSRYFQSSDSFDSYIHEGIGAEVTKLPILLSMTPSVDYTYTFNIEKLKVPIDSPNKVKTFLKDIELEGGRNYLDKLSASPVDSITFSAEEAHKILIDSFLSGSYFDYLILKEKASPLNYEVVFSPFQDQWPIAYMIDAPDNKTYREAKVYHEDMSKLPRIEPQFIGMYDPKKLNISIDPLTQVPMETYRTATATYVLNKNSNPVNPPKKVTASSDPYGYIMQSPTMLTTINASKEFLGEKSISSIRVKVVGVEDLNEKSQEKLESIAKEIENKTGLKADITLGSSPQPLLINIPKIDGVEELGWIEQPWIKKGVSINILTETKLGYSGLIICLILVSIIYIFATSFINYLSRKKEFALLKALGWKDAEIIRMVLTESILLSGIVNVISLIVLFILKSKNTEVITWGHVSFILILTIFIYIIGSLWPSYLIAKITPLQILKQGEISTKSSRFGRTRGIFGIVMNNLFGYWLRNIASVLAISLPGSLLILFMFISLRLNGILYTSWLGEYVSMEIGITHYIAVGLSFMIAILTTGEVIWQNLLERANEIALFKALGWRNIYIQMTVLIEGAFLGLLSGIVSLILGVIVVTLLYGVLSFEQYIFYSSILIINICIGVLSALLPSRRVLRIEPIQGLKN